MRLEGVTVKLRRDPVEREHVEARAGARREELEIVGGNAAEPRTFARIDGAERRPEASRRTRFDLDENDRLAVTRHDIDLATGSAKIPRHDPISDRLQIGGCGIFARHTEIVRATHESSNESASRTGA